MKAIMRNKIGFVIISMILIFLCAEMGFTKDYLSLNGVVRSVDSNSGVIRINVTTEGCKGLRDFMAPKDSAKDLDPSLIGKQIRFSIDSPICERGRTYNILLGR